MRYGCYRLISVFVTTLVTIAITAAPTNFPMTSESLFVV